MDSLLQSPVALTHSFIWNICTKHLQHGRRCSGAAGAVVASTNEAWLSRSLRSARLNDINNNAIKSYEACPSREHSRRGEWGQNDGALEARVQSAGFILGSVRRH